MEKNNGNQESGWTINRIYTPPPPQEMDPSKLPASETKKKKKKKKKKKNKKRPPGENQGDIEKLTPAEEL